MTELQRFTYVATPDTRASYRAGAQLPSGASIPVTRGGAPVHTTSLAALLDAVLDMGMKPQESDAWLAPRVHASLRLTYPEASDREMWDWLVSSAAGRRYSGWRWGAGSVADVARDRWHGGINKQALSRLWWGAELMRNGKDYGPVASYFGMQDFPHNLNHRPFMRSRPLALALIAATRKTTSGGKAPTSVEIRSVARTVNLMTAGISIAALSAGYRQDTSELATWLAALPAADPTVTPVGPDDGSVPRAVAALLTKEAQRMVSIAGLTP
jgi:hypothetical protein